MNVKKYKKAIGVIEVILILIVIGFLIAIAIPKTTGHNPYDDKISKESTIIYTIINDLGSYYTAMGKFDDNISKMTYGITSKSVIQIDKKNFIYITFRKKRQCVKFKIYDDGRLEITKGRDQYTTLCKNINEKVKNLIKTHNFGDSIIE